MDRTATDLLQDGHVDALLRRAVALGTPPLWAVQMVTLNPAEYFGLDTLGAVAPGHRANLVVVEDLVDFRCRLVFNAGRLVAADGVLLEGLPSAPPLASAMNVAPFSSASLRIAAGRGRVRAIVLVSHQIETREILTEPCIRDGEAVADPARDLAKLVVVDRHRASGRVGVGFVHGFGLRTGALASSVAHDAHNLIAVGVDDRDLLAALRHVAALGGGLAVAEAGAVRAAVPLEVAGLMSDRPLETTAHAFGVLEATARRLGARVPHPFGALSFLALPVVPRLRLTDGGLIDVDQGRVVPLWTAA